MRKFFFLTLAILAITLAVFGLFWFLVYVGIEPPRETALGIVTSEYSFDLPTIQQVITNSESDIFHLEWRDDGKHTTTATREQIWLATQEIYTKYPELLEAARLTLFGK